MALNIPQSISAQLAAQLPAGITPPSLAIIGGSGLDEYPNAETLCSVSVKTPFATEPVLVHVLGFNDPVPSTLWFLPRHGDSHKLAPHKINYRANIWALKAAGAESLIAVNAVGGISSTMAPGRLLLPSQTIDYSHGRDSSFFDGEHYPLDHIDFSQAADEALRQRLLPLMGEDDTPWCYGCTQGPRLETAAEIRRMAQDGCDVVGMTMMPEAVLAKEAQMAYVSLCMVVNWGAGIEDRPITMEEIYSQLEGCTERARSIIQQFIQNSLS